MNIQKWLSDIDQEVARLTAARKILTDMNRLGQLPEAPVEKKHRKPFSDETRRKMSLGMKRRWREARKSGRTALA